MKIVCVDIKPSVGGKASTGFAVSNWHKGDMVGNEWSIVDFDAGVDGTGGPAVVGRGEACDMIGVSGQGTSPNPPSSFARHYIVRIGNGYYDPSYGIGAFDDRRAYEGVAFSGLIYITSPGAGYKLGPLLSDDGDAGNHEDEICTYVEK